MRAFHWKNGGTMSTQAATQTDWIKIGVLGSVQFQRTHTASLKQGVTLHDRDIICLGDPLGAAPLTTLRVDRGATTRNVFGASGDILIEVPSTAKPGMAIYRHNPHARKGV